MNYKKFFTIVLLVISQRVYSMEITLNQAIGRILDHPVGSALAMTTTVSIALTLKAYEAIQENPITTLSIATTAAVAFTVKKYCLKNDNENTNLNAIQENIFIHRLLLKLKHPLLL